jgi:predicted ester cyclase
MDVAEFIRVGADKWNKRDKQSFLADFGGNCEITGPGGLVLRGRDGAELFWQGYQDAFPDNHIAVRTAFGIAGNGAEEAVFKGTHTGVLLKPDGRQIRPTGRTTKTSFSAIYTYRDDHIATFRLYFDQIELFAQLGVRL